MFIYFIYIPSPIIEVEVLCTSPRDIGEEVEDLLKDLIKYIAKLYIGPDCDIKINKEVIKQP